MNQSQNTQARELVIRNETITFYLAVSNQFGIKSITALYNAAALVKESLKSLRFGESQLRELHNQLFGCDTVVTSMLSVMTAEELATVQWLDFNAFKELYNQILKKEIYPVFNETGLTIKVMTAPKQSDNVAKPATKKAVRKPKNSAMKDALVKASEETTVDETTAALAVALATAE